jgi:hypothetical protein
MLMGVYSPDCGLNLEEGPLRQQRENHFEDELEVLSLEERIS